jgi:hypothetical protein
MYVDATSSTEGDVTVIEVDITTSNGQFFTAEFNIQTVWRSPVD